MLCLNCRYGLVRVTDSIEDDESPTYVITCMLGDESISYDVLDCSHYDNNARVFDENMYEFWRKSS